MSRELDELAEPITVHRWAIIGPYGNIWTPTLFDKPEEAEAHLRDFWGRQGFNGYSATPVEVTVKEIGGEGASRVPLIDRASAQQTANTGGDDE